MKKLIFLAFLVFCLIKVDAQTVNGTPIKDIDVDYIQIIGVSRPFSNKLTIHIDFGQETKFFNAGSESIIRDEQGNTLVFNSIVDAVNFMSKNGFEFANAYAVEFNKQNTYYYLMKNRKLKEKEKE